MIKKREIMSCIYLRSHVPANRPKYINCKLKSWMLKHVHITRNYNTYYLYNFFGNQYPPETNTLHWEQSKRDPPHPLTPPNKLSKRQKPAHVNYSGNTQYHISHYSWSALIKTINVIILIKTVKQSLYILSSNHLLYARSQRHKPRPHSRAWKGKRHWRRRILRFELAHIIKAAD